MASDLETKLKVFGRCGPTEVWVLANTREGGGWERVASCNSIRLAQLTLAAFVRLQGLEGEDGQG